MEEQGVNQMLLHPFHTKLAEIDEKHLAQCIMVAVHWLIQNAAFETKISQNKVTEKFLVHPKTLHIAITGQKFNSRRKFTKKEKAEWLQL